MGPGGLSSRARGHRSPCSIPIPTVDGVVRGIPLGVLDADILSGVESVLGTDGTNLGRPVRTVRRLTVRSGEACRAIRFTFETATLPGSVVLNRREYPVDPYVAEVVRCFKCQKHGHIRRDCRAKQEVCSTCGGRGHTSLKCRATERRCPNCRDQHAAGNRSCPTRLEWCEANRLRAMTYMPKSQAMRLAKEHVGKGALSALTAPPGPTAQVAAENVRQLVSAIVISSKRQA